MSTPADSIPPGTILGKATAVERWSPGVIGEMRPIPTLSPEQYIRLELAKAMIPAADMLNDVAAVRLEALSAFVVTGKPIQWHHERPPDTPHTA